MEEDLKILEEMIEKSKDLREEDFYKIIGIKQLQALFNLIQAYKEQQVKIEMAYRKGKEEATSELTIVKEKLLEENTLENIKLKKELEKKDKIIDLMANNLERCMETNIYDFLDICNKCKSNNEDCHGDYCKDTIKQYFERKVEEK